MEGGGQNIREAGLEMVRGEENNIKTGPQMGKGEEEEHNKKNESQTVTGGGSRERGTRQKNWTNDHERRRGREHRR